MQKVKLRVIAEIHPDFGQIKEFDFEYAARLLNVEARCKMNNFALADERFEFVGGVLSEVKSKPQKEKKGTVENVD